MTTLQLIPLTLPGAWPAENPFPIFRERSPHREVPLHESVVASYRELAGWNAGFRCLPYRMQDRYRRDLSPVTLRTAVLENEILRAEFLPELGGRLRSLLHKPSARELLACNPVLQPANLAIRNAWFSGGIEWNVGQFGHSPFTCSPVFAARITDAAGSPGLRLYEFERLKSLFWQTDFYLPAGSEFLIAHTRVINALPRETSMYWWTNIAVPEGPGVRVLAPAVEALCFHPPGGFGQERLPHLSTFGGRDASYATNSPCANEFFMPCADAPLPFVTALDRTGAGLVQASTPRLNVRKLFCWGMHPGGRHWQEFLAPPGHDYLEIQAGLAPTQLHGLVMPPHASWHWTEVFGRLETNPQQTQAADWSKAVAAAQSSLETLITAERLAAIESACRARVDQPAPELLQSGSGWGALELRRLATQGQSLPPPAFAFPADSLAGDAAGWLPLLDGGAIHADTKAPAWLVQPEWRDLLRASLDRSGGRHAMALVHLGVMACEAFDEADADRCWRESITIEPTVWAWRNLGALASLHQHWSAAADHYAQAWSLAPTLDEAGRTALAREIMQLHALAGDHEAALAFYAGLAAAAQDDDGVQIARARAAMACQQLEVVESILQRDFTLIREGEVSLSDLWYELQCRRTTGANPPTPEQLRDTRARLAAPRRLDFRGKPD